MRKFFEKLTIITAGIVILAMSVIAPLVATAQSNGIGVTPRFDFTVKQGEKSDQKAYVTNPNQDLPLTLKISVVDFKPKNETGEPDFVPREQTTPWSLKPFITIQDSVVIGPKQSLYIPFTITLPQGQGAGSYYSAIQFASVNADRQTPQQVSLSATNTSLIFVQVPGNATELLSLEQFGATENSKFKSVFKKSPSILSYRIKNQGNVAEQPNGGLVIRNTFGKQVKVIDQANGKKELAIIGQTRKFDVCIEDKKDKAGKATGECDTTNLSPGRYTVEMTLLYGENGSREITAETSFWVLPTWFVLSVIGAIALIIFGIFLVYRKFSTTVKTKRVSRSARR